MGKKLFQTVLNDIVKKNRSYKYEERAIILNLFICNMD